MIGFYNASVILTYLGVVSAVFGMSQAFNGNFKIAILCLMISGLTDMYDGTIAKMIKRSEDAKKFGIEIDSLCDLVCFGVYPVVIGYCLGMDQWYARIIYMCYVLGGVIRLAYFNVTEEQRQAHSSSRRKHYQGLPNYIGCTDHSDRISASKILSRRISIHICCNVSSDRFLICI